MNLKQLFYGKVADGKLRLFRKDQWERALQFLNNQEVQLTIEKKKKLRTTKENNYYWGVVVRMICESEGYDPFSENERNQVHLGLREKFLGIEKSGIFKIIKSTTTLSTVEMENYLDRIRLWAALSRDEGGLGLYIPLPNEVDWDQEHA